MSPASQETLPLLLEIGCEEMPARFLAEAQKQLGDQLRAYLRANRLLENPNALLETYSTPRRLVAYLPQVAARQPDKVEDVMGPPVKAAFDAEGKYTRAAEAFAAKHGAEVSALKRVTTPKGEYLALETREHGQPAAEVLSRLLDVLLWNMSFPKSIHWGKPDGAKFSFLRPIRWIVALLGEGKSAEVIPFNVAGVPAGHKTFGHRLAGRNAIAVSGFADLERNLRAAKVEINSEARREMIREASKVLLEGSESLVEDAELETWHVNSTEWPSAIAGAFDHSFLELPREILITVMRGHQKYFAVEDSAARLRPRFMAILNRADDPKGLIRAGHERVLRARFSDARFFWDTDQKIPLRDRLPLLEKVTYHEKLGSYADKVRRMEAIAGEICRVLRDQGKMTLVDETSAKRAVQLCKCDLTTQMVQEFPELQGVVGGLYATAQGEPPEVADAIYDHYLPQGAEDRCPRTTIGAVVSLADKFDSVAEGFRAGLAPTGSSDPFGLRRAGNGVIKIAIEALPGFDVLAFAERTVEGSRGPVAQGDPVGTLCSFLRERTEFYLRTSGGLRGDTVRAIVHSFKSWSPPSDALLRGKQLEPFVTTDAFQALAVAAKRTRNILSKSATQADRGDRYGIEEHLLSAGPERDMFEAYLKLKGQLEDFAGRGMYAEAFKQVAQVRPVVDRFFDKVMVMDENLDLRANRLRLLDHLNALVFLRFADLSQIESSGSTVGAPTSEEK